MESFEPISHSTKTCSNNRRAWRSYQTETSSSRVRGLTGRLDWFESTTARVRRRINVPSNKYAISITQRGEWCIQSRKGRMSPMDTTFPFKRAFNLGKLIEFWQDAANDDESSILSAHAQTLLTEVNKRPELLEPDITAETFKRHDDLVPYLMTPLIPLGGSTKLYAAAIPPFKVEPYFATECFDELDLSWRLSSQHQTPRRRPQFGRTRRRKNRQRLLRNP